MFKANWKEACAYAGTHFEPKLKSYINSNNALLWLPSCVVTWLAALFLLFVLTAYRPVVPEWLWFLSWWEIEWSNSKVLPNLSGPAKVTESGESSAALATSEAPQEAPASGLAAESPSPDTPEVALTGKEVDTVNATDKPHPFAYMHNRISAMSLREYLGRMVGAIPPACAITQGNLPRPTGSGTPGQPWILAVSGFDQGEATNQYIACLWRDDPRSILAAFSLDVGVVQKVTLLLLVFALFILIRNKRFRKVEEEAWPVNDNLRGPNKPGWRTTIVSAPQVDEEGNAELEQKSQPIKKHAEKAKRMPEVAHHPIRYTVPSNVRVETGTEIPEKMLFQTFYPTEDLPLDPMTKEDSAARKYEQGLSEVTSELFNRVPDDSLRGPVDLIKDVLKAGAHSGRVGDAERRMRVAVYEYTSSLSERLDMAHYLMWLLPTVGFLGTIYGISASLVRAKGLFGGTANLDPNEFSENIQLVVDGLGVAFDTTSMALICAAFLYWCLVRAEQDIRLLSTRARDSLSNLLVDRLIDRVMQDKPPDPDLDRRAPSEGGTDAPKVIN